MTTSGPGGFRIGAVRQRILDTSERPAGTDFSEMFRYNLIGASLGITF